MKHVSTSICLVFLALLPACEEQKPAPAADNPPAVSALKPAEPAPVASAAEPEEAEKPARPATIETDLTDDRRAKVEKEYAQARGFLVAKEIETSLKENKAVKEEKNAIKAFDAKAKGKWVLFSGTMVNLTEKGFDMAVVYTPQLPNDPMGMSRQFFTVTFAEVEGYDSSKFKVGNTGVVLAKYNGDKMASPGYELVEAGHWQ